MIIAFLAVAFGVAFLVWSADKFVEGAAVTAKRLKVAPFLIGMVVVGFGTSAPEMLISALSASQGNSGIAIGNAYGSNITNIALILGLTSLIKPISVHPQVLRKELPILIGITALAIGQLWDGEVSRIDALVLLAVFSALMGWTILREMKKNTHEQDKELEQYFQNNTMTMRQAVLWLIVGLSLLIISSRVLVWGAVEIARSLGVSDLIIGLTIIAVGTSLPELASSIIASKKGNQDIVLGNILGSNLFNTLVVVGIAGTIHPITINSEVLLRDVPVMAVLTLSLFVIGYGWKKTGHINRLKGGILLAYYIGYITYLVGTVFLT